MRSYRIKSSEHDRVLFPSHFSPNGWKFAAFDHEDFEDNSSIIRSTETAQVLYQETTAPPNFKPFVSSTNLSKHLQP